MAFYNDISRIPRYFGRSLVQLSSGTLFASQISIVCFFCEREDHDRVGLFAKIPWTSVVVCRLSFHMF